MLSELSEVKIFRVEGEIRKPNYKTKFRKELLDVDPSKAIERVLSELGSKHKAKRFEIKILEVKEIKPEEVTDPRLRRLIESE
mgnify:CR=1 FL=1